MSEKLWIKKAVKRKGAYRESVKRRYGKKGFVRGDTERGQIKESVKRKDARKKGRVGKQARLAITLEKLPRKT